MCGLTGFTMTRPIEPKPVVLTMFASLFIMSQLRGVDSSGISINWRRWSKNYKKNANQAGWLTYKELTAPYSVYSRICQELVERHASDSKKNAFDDPFISTAICHARAATKGTVSRDNAHPFSFGNNRFIGVHNGTITNPREVYNTLVKNNDPLPNTTEPPVDYSDLKVDVTDSEIILYCIYRFGIEEVYPIIEGAWAFVFYRQDTGHLYFIRNSQRPLHILWSSVDDVMFWSSEAKMIEFCAKRYSFGHEWTNNKHCELDTHKLYSIELRKDLGLKYSDTTFPWSSTKELKPKNYSGSYTTYGKYDGAYSGEAWGWESWEEDVKKEEKKEETKQTSVIVANTPNNETSVKYRFSQKQNKVIPIAEYLAEKAAENKTKINTFTCDLPKEEEESVESSREDSHCCWCAKVLTNNNKKNSLKIKETGTVCGDCTGDIGEVEAICDLYANAAADPEWIKLYCDLSDQEKKKGNKRA